MNQLITWVKSRVTPCDLVSFSLSQDDAEVWVQWMVIIENDDAGHKPWRPHVGPWRPNQCRPQTMMATINVNDGHTVEFDGRSMKDIYIPCGCRWCGHHNLWPSWIGRHSLPCGRHGHVVWSWWFVEVIDFAVVVCVRHGIGPRMGKNQWVNWLTQVDQI